MNPICPLTFYLCYLYIFIFFSTRIKISLRPNWNKKKKERMRMKVDTDSILVPLSLVIAVGYHVFLWNTFKHNPSRTSLGIDSSKRKSWFRDIKEVLLFFFFFSFKNKIKNFLRLYVIQNSFFLCDTKFCTQNFYKMIWNM